MIMKNGRFTAQEREYLLSLDAVEDVRATCIMYSASFKHECLRRYDAGESPSRIFASVGLPASLIGYKRIERAIYHWKEADKKDALGLTDPPTIQRRKHADRLLSEKKAAVERQRNMRKRDRQAYEARIRELEAQVELLKAEGVSVRSSSDKARIVDALADRYHKTELFAVVGITSATYYRQVAIRDRIDKYAQVREELKEAFHSSNGTYGYRRVHAMLVRGGRRISEKVVMRLMREEGCIVAKRLQGRSWSSYAGESSPAPPNIMARDFHAQAPNMRWVTDITEMRAADGKVYLSPVVDCFDGMVVAYTIGRSPTAELANGMLRRALSTLRQGALPPMIHSDRGGHYRWPEWVRICEGAGVVRSMSKKGCSPDNAACEGFFGTFKSEAYYPRGWSKMTADELMAATGDYIDWYNGSRIKESLGWKSPAEYREEQGMMPNSVS